ncbi:pilus assembly protein [Jannaschia sp. S6380]|uniref:pilus assembly protein n=1 Tax=Jannaschia sp. S6380 TaxID=2926408 RepID=UPI001FF56F85|nr:pilus assembly protein [Jannaschia sp. S6380]MCK0169299.1 pilus assembly protein [Jannaschia sp. S6380]
MLKSINTFLKAEDGAVTVDWVVLTAALVGLGLAVMGVVSTGVGNVSAEMKTQLEVDHVKASKELFNAGLSGSSSSSSTTGG